MIHEQRPTAAESSAEPRWEIEQAVLKNGLRIAVAERDGIGTIEVRLAIEGGALLENATERGLTALAVRLVGDLQIMHPALVAEIASLGTTLRARAAPDGGIIEISSLPAGFDHAVATLGKLVTSADFAQGQVAAAKAACMATIRDEIARPAELALRTLPRLVYPDQHPYARPFTGSARAEEIARATLEQVGAFKSRWLRPNRATLIAVGPVGIEEMTALAEKHLGVWQPSHQAPSAPLPPASDASRRAGAMIDRAGQAQAGIFAALPLPPRSQPESDALTLADALLGGMFSSRLNLALRERHGWSYGARSRILYGRYAGMWLVQSLVAADRLEPAIAEIGRQIDGISGPIEDREFVRARNYLLSGMVALNETNARLADAMLELVLQDLPHHYYAEMGKRLLFLQRDALSAACRPRFDRSKLAWLIVGDVERLASQLAAADLGELVAVAPDQP